MFLPHSVSQQSHIRNRDTSALSNPKAPAERSLISALMPMGKLVDRAPKTFTNADDGRLGESVRKRYLLGNDGIICSTMLLMS